MCWKDETPKDEENSWESESYFVRETYNLVGDTFLAKDELMRVLEG